MGASKTATTGCDLEILYLGTLVNTEGVDDDHCPTSRRRVDDWLEYLRAGLSGAPLASTTGLEPFEWWRR
jgi:hypothetical protein